MRIPSLTLAMLLSLSMPALANTSPCLTNADSVTDMRFDAGLPYDNRDSASTIAAGLPWASRANIQVVTDSVVCAAGVSAINEL